MKVLLEKLLELKEKERAIKEERTLIEGEIYALVETNLNDDKALNVVADQYKLTVKPNFSIKVNQDLAKDHADLFKVKYELSYSQYKKLEGKVDDMVTINQIKPTFTVINKDELND